MSWPVELLHSESKMASFKSCFCRSNSQCCYLTVSAIFGYFSSKLLIFFGLFKPQRREGAERKDGRSDCCAKKICSGLYKWLVLLLYKKKGKTKTWLIILEWQQPRNKWCIDEIWVTYSVRCCKHLPCTRLKSNGLSVTNTQTLYTVTSAPSVYPNIMHCIQVVFY
jgi:hypothetical protein